MRSNILKHVFFSIIICSFEYAQNEICFINKRTKYIESNITYFRNNRILADPDNQFDLSNFHELTLSIVNQLIEYNNDDKEMTNIHNTIVPYINKHKESGTLPDLNKVHIALKLLLHAHQKELEKLKKELDNLKNDELETQRVHDKRILKKDENNSVSEHKNFEQLKNKGISSKEKHNKIDSSSNNELKNNAKLESVKKKVKALALLYTQVLPKI
ncbi:fam-b protein [Plasmodium vinckei lentum]|uniref:Fam-b protein n=1 Tax=Plasmodium vinckei lentum TaxID=138297 RepID=A0A6V7S0J1_PLAVN|nr:fam-b protein [Plasmodium vinckei lentum]